MRTNGFQTIPNGVFSNVRRDGDILVILPYVRGAKTGTSGFCKQVGWVHSHIKRLHPLTLPTICQRRHRHRISCGLCRTHINALRFCPGTPFVRIFRTIRSRFHLVHKRPRIVSPSVIHRLDGDGRGDRGAVEEQGVVAVGVGAGPVVGGVGVEEFDLFRGLAFVHHHVHPSFLRGRAAGGFRSPALGPYQHGEGVGEVPGGGGHAARLPVDAQLHLPAGGEHFRAGGEVRQRGHVRGERVHLLVLRTVVGLPADGVTVGVPRVAP